MDDGNVDNIVDIGLDADGMPDKYEIRYRNQLYLRPEL